MKDLTLKKHHQRAHLSIVHSFYYSEAVTRGAL